MKKRAKAIILTVSALTIATVGAISVHANNYIDSPYYFTFSRYATQTDFRPKQDDSSSYMKCQYAEHSYTAQVISRSTQTGGNIDCSMGHTYQFKTGTVYYMINSVWESGHHEGAIYATRDYGSSYNAHGLWSPDSI